jgi:hypothetical protein
MTVSNMRSTSHLNCECGTWLDHWKRFSRQDVPRFCPTAGCWQAAQVGAHVQKNSPTDRNEYIVPLCKGCNAKLGAPLEISDNVALVSANISGTCAKK